MRPLPIPHLHDWRNMEVCLINFNKGKDDEGCLKFCNILKYSRMQLCNLFDSQVRCIKLAKKWFHESQIQYMYNFLALVWNVTIVCLHILYLTPVAICHHSLSTYTLSDTSSNLSTVCPTPNFSILSLSNTRIFRPVFVQHQFGDFLFFIEYLSFSIFGL